MNNDFFSKHRGEILTVLFVVIVIFFSGARLKGISLGPFEFEIPSPETPLPVSVSPTNINSLSLIKTPTLETVDMLSVQPSATPVAITPTYTQLPTVTMLIVTPSQNDCFNAPRLLSIDNYAFVATSSDPLHLRLSPGKLDASLEKIKPKTKVYVLDGPVCQSYYGIPYWWWKVQTPSGKIGWVVEGSDAKDVSFLLPVK